MSFHPFEFDDMFLRQFIKLPPQIRIFLPAFKIGLYPVLQPAFFPSLYYILTELATFNNSGALSRESRDDQIRLTQVLNNLETDYKNNNLYSMDLTDLKYYLINHSENDFKKLMEEFEVIRPLL